MNYGIDGINLIISIIGMTEFIGIYTRSSSSYSVMNCTSQCKVNGTVSKKITIIVCLSGI